VNIVVQWMTSLLKLLYDMTSLVGIANYGVAIILLTIIIKTLIFPLTWKQMKSMRKTVEIQPLVKELQKKYKNDPQKLNAETMELYKKHSVNPAGGCLPIVIQLPIFWALYSTLFNFGNYIADPSQAHFLWFNLTAKDPYFILAILAAATTFLQTKLTNGANPAASTDPTQKTMLYIMPIFMGYISSNVPSGLALYWVTMNIVSVLQQMYINRRLEKEKEQAA
jgi:YidC/Oxa1 family membrane protein insertase